VRHQANSAWPRGGKDLSHLQSCPSTHTSVTGNGTALIFHFLNLEALKNRTDTELWKIVALALLQEYQNHKDLLPSFLQTRNVLLVQLVPNIEH